ncbi:MAG: extradiol ring-cleavage dioxygenase [Actinomycetota bacterium]
MAEIVMGLGTSHGSQVSLTPDWWAKHGELDRKRTPYEELLQSDGKPDAQELAPEVFQRKYDAVQEAVGHLGAILAEAALDAVVVVGDDQGELYSEGNMPAVAMYWGDSVLDIPRDLSDVPASRAAAMWAKHAGSEEAYPVASALGKHIIERAVDEGFDVAQMREQPAGRSIGHAFTFVRLRLMKDAVVPMVPILLNTYFPPNQPTARRCYDLGEAVRRAIESWPEPARVGVVASGGLSHFVVDEELDQTVLKAIAGRDASVLGSLPEDKLQSGSSEIKNWVVTAAALDHLRFEEIDYVPGYRSAAGTGCGMAFGRWR